MILFLYFCFITSIREHNELQEENAKGKVDLYRWIDRPSMDCLQGKKEYLVFQDDEQIRMAMQNYEKIIPYYSQMS